MWVDLCDRHVSLGALLGRWEEGETRFMRSTLKPGQTVVDAGANIGWFTLVAAECVGARGRVFSFEPQARIFAYLARTIADNGLAGRVVPYPMALAESWRTLWLRWSPASANAGHAWLDREAPGGPGDLGPVRTGVLDDLLADQAVDFLKIDAEGAEGLILTGARKLLAERRPAVMVEMMPTFLKRVSGMKPAELFEFFAALGYSGFTIELDGRLGTAIAAWPEDKAELNLAFLPSPA